MPFCPTLRRVAVSLTLVIGAAIQAQTFDLDRDRRPVASLDGLWRFHPGDDPRWADPNFDDSSWGLLRSDQPWATQGYADLSGYAWYRFAVRLPAGSGPTSLLFMPIYTGYRVYVDGRLVGGVGAIEPTLLTSLHFVLPATMPLTATTAPQPRTLHIAIRVWHSAIWSKYQSGGPVRPGNLVCSTPLALREMRTFQRAYDVYYIDSYLTGFLAFIVGLTMLALCFMRPRDREYWWFTAILLLGCAQDTLEFFYFAYSILPTQVFDLVDHALGALGWTACLYFFAIVLNQRRGPWFRIGLIMLLLSTLDGVTNWFHLGTPAVTNGLDVVMELPAALWIITTLIRSALRRNPDGYLLFVPAFLYFGEGIANQFLGSLNQFGWIHTTLLEDIQLPLVPFPISLSEIIYIVFLMSLLAFLVRRFSLARKHEEHLQVQFEAARQVQEILVPEAGANVPGFAVESVYLPAESVGGDFFQQIPDGEGGLLVVIGDVAGKGLPAAMVVAMMVGAIRAEADHSADPAQLLRSLNTRLVGRSQGGFSTCLAAHISSKGRLTLANAGHFPPWINGFALDLPGSLPLGVAADPGYESTTVGLKPGDRLTFLSDGVVEAQGASGELFGFERTGEISQKTAEAIARAAQLYGQCDDITVVAVEFEGVASAALA